MNLRLDRSSDFIRDFEFQFEWYYRQAGEAVADHYSANVLATLAWLNSQPNLGKQRRFRHRDLQGIRSHSVQTPFDAHLIFYRFTHECITAERILHGARDLPRRLRQPPGA